MMHRPMPVYLFTLHSYGSWLPDHRRGYTKRNQGIFPTDEKLAGYYRDKVTQDAATFDRRAQHACEKPCHVLHEPRP